MEKIKSMIKDVWAKLVLKFKTNRLVIKIATKLGLDDKIKVAKKKAKKKSKKKTAKKA